MKRLILRALLLSILTAPCIFISCTDPPVGIITKPSISISNPPMNSNVPDSTTITIDINNINNIIRVELFINHEFVTYFSKPPYNFFWNTSYYNDGSQFIIEAKAYDDKGNVYSPTPSIIYAYRFMPSGLQANLLKNSTIVLHWYDNCKFETGFEVEQAASDSIFKRIAVLDSNTTTDTIKGNFTKDQTYLFRVRAKAKNSYSGYSNIAKAYPLLNPPEITGLVYNSDTTATITWLDNNDFETGFSITTYVNSSYYSNIGVLANTTSANINCDFYNGIYYGFMVAALDGWGYSAAQSSYKTFQFIFNPPTNLTAAAVDPGKIQLNWTNSTSYSTPVKIERRDTNSAYQEIGKVIPGVTTFTDNNLDTSKTYYYRVKAYTRINTVYSNEIKVGFVPHLVDVRKIPIPNYNISAIALSPDASKIVLGCYPSLSTMAAVLLDASDGSIIRTYYPKDSMQQMYNVGISYDNSIIAGGGYSKNINLWNVSDGSYKASMNLAYDPAGLFFHPSRNQAITFTGLFYYIGIWNYETPVLVHNISANESIHSFDFSPNGNLLAAGGDNDIKIIDLTTGTVIKTLASGTTFAVTFCDDNIHLISGYQGIMEVWNLTDLTSTVFTNNNYGFINSIIALPGTNYVVLNNYLKIVDRSTGKIISTSTTDENSIIKLLPDGTVFYSGSGSYFHFKKLQKNWSTLYE